MTQQHFDAVQKIPTTDAKELFHICSYCNHNPLSHMLRKTRLITCFIIRYFKWDQRSTMLPTHTKYSTEISRFGISLSNYPLHGLFFWCVRHSFGSFCLSRDKLLYFWTHFLSVTFFHILYQLHTLIWRILCDFYAWIMT